MNCRDVIRELEAAREPGAAPAPPAVRDHASECASCARLVRAEDEMRAGMEALRRAADATPIPPEFARRVARAARERASESRPRPAWPLAAGFAAAAGVLAAALLALGPQPVAPSPAGIAALPSSPSSPATRGASSRDEGRSGFSPVVFSDRGVDIVAEDPAAPDRPGADAPAQAAPADRVAVLVEWNL